MDRSTLEQFRTRARRVTLPEDVRESVLDEIRAERGERTRDPRRPRRERRGVTRRTFVRAGAVAAGGVAAFLGASALMNRLADKEGNWFALTAYAEGTGGEGNTHLALGRLFNGTLGWSGGPESEFIMVNTVLDLTCTGANVRTITYSLEGDNVIAEQGLRMESGLASRQGIWIHWPGGSVQSYTVPYDEQIRTDTTGSDYRVYANAPLGDEMRGLLAQMQDLHDAISAGDEPSEDQLGQMAELSDRGSVCALEVLATELERATLVMTADFSDGSAQTKRYAFSTREGYAQIYAGRLEEMASAEPERAEALRTNPPSLFYLTELAE